jgi:hypothetical protein
MRNVNNHIVFPDVRYLMVTGTPCFANGLRSFPAWKGRFYGTSQASNWLLNPIVIGMYKIRDILHLTGVYLCYHI